MFLIKANVDSHYFTVCKHNVQRYDFNGKKENKNNAALL